MESGQVDGLGYRACVGVTLGAVTGWTLFRQTCRKMRAGICHGAWDVGRVGTLKCV
jgi:hypothetical protein